MDHCIEKRLGSTTLTIAILVVFVVVLVLGLARARILRLVLAGLVVTLSLPMLAGLTTLLTLLLHIVSHKAFLLK